MYRLWLAFQNLMDAWYWHRRGYDVAARRSWWCAGLALRKGRWPTAEEYKQQSRDDYKRQSEKVP